MARCCARMGKAGVDGEGPDVFQQADRCADRARWRHLRRRPVMAIIASSIRSAWQVHQGMGQQGSGPGQSRRRIRWRWMPMAACFVADREKQSRRDIRSGRQVHRRLAAIRPAERRLHSTNTTFSMSPTRSRTTRPIPASSAASASAAPRPAWSRLSFRSPIPTCRRRKAPAARTISAPKASPPTMPATSMVPRPAASAPRAG